MKKKLLKGLVVSSLLCASLLTGCSSSNDQVVIYSNADDEAVTAMKNALDKNGYEGQYLFQTFGTSELGGKLLAEGTNIEADLVTMSSFYLDSAQEQKKMFVDLDFDTQALDEYPSYYTPITSQEGAIIINTEELKANSLETPTCLKDLAKPEYKDMISVTDIASSSTAWLLIQALVSEYGEDGAKEVLKGIYDNAGAHIEDSGSGPIKKVRAGEIVSTFAVGMVMVLDIVTFALEGACMAVSGVTGKKFHVLRQGVDVVSILLVIIIVIITDVPLAVREGTIIGMFLFGPMMGIFMKLQKPVFKKFGLIDYN